MNFRALTLGALALPLHALLGVHDSGKFLQPVSCNCMMYQPMYPPMYQPMYTAMMVPPVPLPPQMYQPQAVPGQPLQAVPPQIYQRAPLGQQVLNQAVPQQVYQLRASSLAQQAPTAPAPSMPPAPAMAPAPLTPGATTPAPTEEPGSPEASEDAVKQAAEDAA